jgi:chromosome segregation ATPase
VKRQEGHETNGEHPQEEGLNRKKGEEAVDTTEVEVARAEISDPEELRARLGIKDNRIRELFEEITASRLAADEASASRAAGEGHIESLETEAARLKERIRDLEEEVRGRRRRRESFERQIARLERELERKDGEISHRDYLLERLTEQLEAADQRAGELASRKDHALQDALRRVDGLERDLEEREGEISNLTTTVEMLERDLESERELRSRLADPANRLRAGIDLFNESEQRRSMNALSRTLGKPEVHVELDRGDEPPALLTFTWQGVTWQTYTSDPGLDVEEPRVYLKGAGEDLSGVDRKPPNARVGPGDRVILGL